MVEELSTRMVKLGHQVTCYNRGGHHVSGKEFDGAKLHEWELLGCLHIRLLFNPEKRHLAVQACARRKPESFVVPHYEPETWAFPISSFPLSKMLSECCAWERDKTYRVFGELHKDYRLVEFDLTQAVIYTEE